MSEPRNDPHLWFDEISFDPEAPLLQMGTRRLGDARWLVVDEQRETELALKSTLLAERHDDVFAVSPDHRASAERAAVRLLDMIRGELGQLGLVGPDLGLAGGDFGGVEPGGAATGAPHPLEQAGRLVQEDLCLIHFRDGTWHVDAASLCFPSRWRLADKIGRPLVAVHSPVDGYDPVLAARVNKAFDHLLERTDDRPVWRRNWFVHPNPSRYQPASPAGGDPLVLADRVRDGLWVRSERQVLRRVVRPDWAVFSIRIQQASLGELCVDPSRRARLLAYFGGASATDVAHHGVSAAQRGEVLAALSD